MGKKTIIATKIIIAAVAVALIGWDIFVAINGCEDDTISEVILNWSKELVSVPFAYGILLSHFFLPRKQVPSWWKKLLGVGLSGVAMIGIDIYSHNGGVGFGWMNSCLLIPVVLGAVIGYFCWPQQKTPDKT
jgi:hypothetical protein